MGEFKKDQVASAEADRALAEGEATVPASSSLRDGDPSRNDPPYWQEIIKHVDGYRVSDGDPRRRYTLCQLNLAVRLAIQTVYPTEPLWSYLRKHYRENDPTTGEFLGWPARALALALAEFEEVEGPFEVPLFAQAMEAEGRVRSGLGAKPDSAVIEGDVPHPPAVLTEIEGLVDLVIDCAWACGAFSATAPKECQRENKEQMEQARTALLSRISPREENTSGRGPSDPGCRPSEQAPSGLAASGASIPRARCCPVSVGEETTLAMCPVGLFLSDYGTLCLKSEYGNNQGRIDAYIVDSGEFFWGEHPQTIANQRMSRVRPVTIAFCAPGGEARSAETRSGSVHEHPIDEVEAPASKDQPPTPSDPTQGLEIDHEFKGHPSVFWPLARGEKTFEFRKDDRPGGYHVGQVIRVRCYDPEAGYLDAPPVIRRITNILRPGEFGLQDGHCILSLAPIAPTPSRQEKTEEGSLQAEAPIALRMTHGCLSAVSPCRHQQSDPYSLCAVCQQSWDRRAAPRPSQREG